MRIEAGVRFLFAKVPIYKGTERVRSTLAGLAFLRLLSVEFTEKIPRALHIKSAFPDDFWLQTDIQKFGFSTRGKNLWIMEMTVLMLLPLLMLFPLSDHIRKNFAVLTNYAKSFILIKNMQRAYFRRCERGEAPWKREEFWNENQTNCCADSCCLHAAQRGVPAGGLCQAGPVRGVRPDRDAEEICRFRWRHALALPGLHQACKAVWILSRVPACTAAVCDECIAGLIVIHSRKAGCAEPMRAWLWTTLRREDLRTGQTIFPKRNQLSPVE